MKTLKEYIIEKGPNKNNDLSDVIFIIKDKDGYILGASEIEDDAKSEADEYNKKTPSIEAKVYKEKKSEYIKK